MSFEKMERIKPALVADEAQMLNGWLDYHRATLLQKIEGVSETEARRQVLSTSSLTLLSLLKHLAYVERWWFQEVFAARGVDFPEDEFSLEPADTVTSIMAFYWSEIQKSREILTNSKLDDMAKNLGQQHSLRWIVTHMIEETARHNGHADLLREAIDGTTGV